MSDESDEKLKNICAEQAKNIAVWLRTISAACFVAGAITPSISIDFNNLDYYNEHKLFIITATTFLVVMSIDSLILSHIILNFMYKDIWIRISRFIRNKNFLRSFVGIHILILFALLYMYHINIIRLF